MQLTHIVNVIEKAAPPELAADWDNSGMQVAGRKNDVESIALCLDPTPSAVERAADAGVQLLVTHHPLLLVPRLPSEPDNFHAVLSLLFRADMALYAAHTPLDVVMDGPAGWPAEEFRLDGCRPLEPLPGRKSARVGYGLVGDLPEVLTFEELSALLASRISLETAHLAGPPPPRSLRRIAVCPGSGFSLARAAADAGADIFVSGDIKYHYALDPPLPLLDVGHHGLEEEMIRRFADLLRDELRGVHVHFFPSANPVRPACAGVCKPVSENTR
jgi:dinuclear metal center YbgI/SA1388 family protein